MGRDGLCEVLFVVVVVVVLFLFLLYEKLKVISTCMCFVPYLPSVKNI